MALHLESGGMNLSGRRQHQRNYQLLLDAGFEDAWSRLSSDAGFTRCQAELLDNESSQLSERIDLILTRGPRKPKRAEVVGEVPADRFGGLWPFF